MAPLLQTSMFFQSEKNKVQIFVSKGKEKNVRKIDTLKNLSKYSPKVFRTLLLPTSGM